MIIEGLGFLSLMPDSSGGPVSEVPLRDGAPLQASSQLWVASLSSDEDNDDEVLAPQTPLASAKDVVSGSVLDTIDVRRDEKVLAEPCDGLFVVVAALRDEEGWVQVGQGDRHDHGPSALHRKEGLEHSLAFKCWARGRCFRCLERDHQVKTCREPYRCIRCRVLVIGSVSTVRAFLQLVLALWTLQQISGLRRISTLRVATYRLRTRMELVKGNPTLTILKSVHSSSMSSTAGLTCLRIFLLHRDWNIVPAASTLENRQLSIEN
jgi:hypothetical protein